MKRCLVQTIIVCCMVIASGSVGTSADNSEGPIALVPRPAQMERKSGTFTLKASTEILVQRNSTDARNVGEQLAKRLSRGAGMTLKVSPSDGKAAVHNAILLMANADPALIGPEGYELEATPDRVLICASDGPGLFYGMQTLLQLLPPRVFSPTKAEGPAAWQIPAVRIVDRPRFHWRGLMLDVSRHFFNKEEVKNYLDLMAQHKLNTFHFHLVDEPGWRIEIKRYPKLTEIGAWRKGIDFGLDPKSSTAYGPDGRYGGFYTQDDIREIVAYAKARYITVVPEIEMPGHSRAAISVYPEFSCFGRPHDRCSEYCAGNDEVFTFLQNVLTEVIGLFPSKYIHIGGDEVVKDDWKKCPKCQARIKHEGLRNENELQSYFVKRIERFVNGQGRTLVGWDEILEGGLAPNAVVMSWRGFEGGIAAANAGHDVVMTPMSHCYFNCPEAQSDKLKSATDGITSLKTVYGFEPVPKAIPADKVKHILGADANLWAEFFPNYPHVQYMTYPRACALAEVTWSDPKLKRWEDFRSRLDVHLQRLKVQGVNYRKP